MRPILFIQARIFDGTGSALFAGEALVAATKLGGELMGEELGLIREGWLADLLVVDGDPTRDVTILQDSRRLLIIMKDGALHKCARRDRDGEG
jgi:imidazolonepropionase-like amidohydrolase